MGAIFPSHILVPESLASLQDEIPLERLGNGEHFQRRKPLSRRLDTVVTDLTATRVAVLHAEIGGISHRRGKVRTIRPARGIQLVPALLLLRPL